MRAEPVFLALAVVTISACGPEERPGIPPRNLLVITVEDLRPDHMSCYAYSRPTTSLPSDPTQRASGRAFDIDELARTGVLFAGAYAPAATTIPSLVTLFTGRSPLATGVLEFSDRLDAGVPTLAEILRGEGFETVALVTHQPPELGLSLARGFDAFRQCADDDETLARARMWVEERDFGDERPFFLWLHLGGASPPFARGRSPGGSVFAREGYRGPAERPLELLETLRKGEVEPDARDWAHFESLYDGALSDLSAALAGFLGETFDWHLPGAEASETWAHTLVVLTAPHGTDFQRSTRELGHARNLSEAALRVPLILRHPDSLTGERMLTEIVGLEDVLPTVCAWFEVPLPPGADGRSLLGITDAGAERPFESRPAFGTLLGRMFTVRTSRWRLILDPERVRFLTLAFAEPPESDVALFDLAADPRGQRDVAAEHPEVVAELRAELEAWRSASAAR